MLPADQLGSGSAAGLLAMAVPAILGLLAGWLGAYLKVKGENLATREDFHVALRQIEESTRAVEAVKAAVTRQQALDSEVREAIRKYAVALESLIHSVCWLTWDSTARERIDPEMTKRYDEEVHRICPDIVGHLALISMLRPEVHDRLASFSDAVFSLDVSVASAIVLAERDQSSGLDQLKACHTQANELDRRFRQGLVNICDFAEARETP